MDREKILESVCKLESIFTQCDPVNLKNSDQVITREIVKIRQLSKDDKITELIFSIYHNWKVYSGQRISAGFAARRFIELCYIFEDLATLKIYIEGLTEVENIK